MATTAAGSSLSFSFSGSAAAITTTTTATATADATADATAATITTTAAAFAKQASLQNVQVRISDRLRAKKEKPVFSETGLIPFAGHFTAVHKKYSDKTFRVRFPVPRFQNILFILRTRRHCSAKKFIKIKTVPAHTVRRDGKLHFCHLPDNLRTTLTLSRKLFQIALFFPFCSSGSGGDGSSGVNRGTEDRGFVVFFLQSLQGFFFYS